MCAKECEKIVALMGDVPRVELFARQTPPGWDVWGNEVESTIRDFKISHFGTKCPSNPLTTINNDICR